MGGMGWTSGMRKSLTPMRRIFPTLPALPARPARPALPALMIALSIACTAPPPDDRDYATKIAADRAAKDAAFTASSDPIPTATHAQFLPLAYFPIDAEFNVPAELKRIDDPTVVDMPTSTGNNRKMRRVGTLQFVLKGQPLSMLAFLEVGETSGLFVAFSDLTSGTDTYAAAPL